MNLLQSMYQKHPINKDIAGTVETIAEITPEILYECYHSYYNLNNMVLCIAGNADLGLIEEIADKKLKINEAVQTESIFPDEPYEVGKSYVEQSLPVAMPMMALGFKEEAGKGFASTKELLCSSILLEAFAGEGSALYRKLLDKKLINSTFGTEYMEGKGYRTVIFEGETADPAALSRILKEEITLLHQQGISQQDFESAKRCTYGRLARGLDAPSSVASSMIGAAFAGRKLFESIELIADITLEDVNERLKEQLDVQNCCLSVIKGIEGISQT